MDSKKIILRIIAIIIIIILGIILFNNIRIENKLKIDEQRRKDLYTNILDGASIKPANLTINYNDQSSKGSPLVFGGAHNPDLNQQDAWDKMSETGVTFLRRDLFMEDDVPNDITLDDYKRNVNNVQDPSTWNQRNIAQTKSIYENAKKRGMKVMAIISYNPKWLTHSGTTHGVPKDWSVFEDIVNKEYRTYREYIDYLEIWNEPESDLFIDIKGSSYSKEEAYLEMFKHSMSAIKSVDESINDGKDIKIGGPAFSGASYFNPDRLPMLDFILSNDEYKNNIDFFSYHSYGDDEFIWDTYKQYLKKYDLENIPIFITEWNYDEKGTEKNPFKTSNPAITYTGNKFLDYLTKGVSGANYFSLGQVRELAPGIEPKYLSFYRWQNNSAELLPQSRTWKILSVNLGLGKGESKIYSISPKSDDFNSIGFQNIENQNGIALVNSSPSARMAEVNLVNTNIKHVARVKMFYASAGNDANVPIYDGLLREQNSNFKFTFYIPGETIVGITFTQEPEWYDNLHLPIDKFIN